MKISPADKAFGDCVKARDNHTCQVCGIEGRMETSHIHSRRHRTIRWDMLNAVAKCHGCHRWWGESPLEASAWFISKYGQGRADLLTEKKNLKFKVSKTEEKNIASHYREELKKFQAAANEGRVYEIVSYQ